MSKAFLALMLILLFLSLPFPTLANGYTNVTVSEAKAMIDSNSSLVVLDVRTQSEYDSGHIRNAKHIPVTELESRLDELNTIDEILVYCKSGGRSATASQTLVNNGFSYVYNMLGGITAWKNEGYPVYVKYSSIQEAINDADFGDTIYVSSGTYYENLITNKTISLVGEDRNNTIIDGDGSECVIYVTANNTFIQRFTIQNGQYGIWLDHSHGNTLTTNNVYFCDSYGIDLSYSNSNTLANNDASYNNGSGIRIQNSNNNLAIKNIATNNEYGIRIIGPSHSNTIKESIITNNDEGIYLNSSYNNIVNNVALDNIIGLNIRAWHNNITGNTINNEIRIEDSNYIRIYHNNFYDVAIAWYGIIHNNNTWDNGCEGNYWNDYDGNDIDSDGIGDIPYVIDGNNTDNYPLMNLYWNPGDVNHDFKVNIYDAVIVCVAYSSTPLDPHWNPHCDIAEPYDVVNIYDIVVMVGNYGEVYQP